MPCAPTRNINPRLRQRQDYSELEFRLAQGPISIGYTGSADYSVLYGYIWAVAIEEGQVRLYQAVDADCNPVPVGTTDGYWNLVEEVPIPHSVDEVHHIGLAFDQATRPMIAYERNDEVWVSQWDPVTQQYIMRGPFPGVDPVVMCDALVMFRVPDSDVLLFHLSTDRTQLLMRAQRENFANPYTLHTFTTPVLLDQVVQYPYRLALVGARSDVPMATEYWLNSHLYPIHVTDGPVVAKAVPMDGEYVSALISYEQNEGTVLTTAVPLDASYYPAVMQYTHTEGVQSSATPLDGIYASVVIRYAYQGENVQATATPLDGIYALAAIRYAITEGVQASATPLDVLYTL